MLDGSGAATPENECEFVAATVVNPQADYAAWGLSFSGEFMRQVVRKTNHALMPSGT
jgi:hypothetical protein